MTTYVCIAIDDSVGGGRDCVPLTEYYCVYVYVTCCYITVFIDLCGLGGML